MLKPLICPFAFLPLFYFKSNGLDAYYFPYCIKPHGALFSRTKLILSFFIYKVLLVLISGDGCVESPPAIPEPG